MLFMGSVTAQVKITIPKRNFQPEVQIQAKLEQSALGGKEETSYVQQHIDFDDPQS
jgi:hypothetical protein